MSSPSSSRGQELQACPPGGGREPGTAQRGPADCAHSSPAVWTRLTVTEGCTFSPRTAINHQHTIWLVGD